jgi:AcrR family transcriptional regulator
MNRSSLILDAAEEEFYRRGFQGAGVAAIATKAGISASAIYRHFESKDEIFAALLDHAVDLLQRYTGPPRDEPLPELDALINGHVDFALTEYRLSSIWPHEKFALVEPYRRRVLRRQMDYLDRWVSALQRIYPDRSRNDVLAVARASQGVITSDVMRSSASQRSALIRSLLVTATRQVVETLAVASEDPRGE